MYWITRYVVFLRTSFYLEIYLIRTQMYGLLTYFRKSINKDLWNVFDTSRKLISPSVKRQGLEDWWLPSDLIKPCSSFSCMSPHLSWHMFLIGVIRAEVSIQDIEGNYCFVIYETSNFDRNISNLLQGVLR